MNGTQISGMSHDAIEMINDVINDARTDPEKWDGLEAERVAWVIRELVRWREKINLYTQLLQILKQHEAEAAHAVRAAAAPAREAT